MSLLIDAFFEDIGHSRIEPVYQHSRFWHAAAATHPLNSGCLWDSRLKLGLCGDWCQMSRIEGAALSGMAMAGRILGSNTAVRQDANDGSA